MPNLRVHLKASKRLLGTQNPWVHQLLDYQGVNLEHRYRHTPEKVEAIVELLGEEVRREAWLHMLMDWKLITERDWTNT